MPLELICCLFESSRSLGRRRFKKYSLNFPHYCSPAAPRLPNNGSLKFNNASHHHHYYLFLSGQFGKDGSASVCIIPPIQEGTLLKERESRIALYCHRSRSQRQLRASSSEERKIRSSAVSGNDGERTVSFYYFPSIFALVFVMMCFFFPRGKIEWLENCDEFLREGYFHPL